MWKSWQEILKVSNAESNNQKLKKKTRNNSDQIVTAATEPLACQRRKRTLAGTWNEMDSLGRTCGVVSSFNIC